MLFAEEIRGIVKTILSQDELLSFERVLESAPEVYDYSGVMTDEQLNHLIAFLSRNKENVFLELKHVKEERDEQAKVIEEQNRCLEEKDEALREKDEAMKDMGAELTKKDRVIRSKDKRISDLEERLAEANEVRYGRRGNKSKQSTKDDESGNSGKGSANGNKNPSGADRQQGEDECDGKKLRIL